uniref:Chloride channel CLIC-like protein 1 n=1 Tax=Panagrolaimus superbus TaxID=310955 RepID=A0A914YAC9_9BILA
MRLILFFATLIISYSIEATAAAASDAAVNNNEELIDPELRIDKSLWKNPNDPLERYGILSYGNCDADEQVKVYKEIIDQKDEEIRDLQYRIQHNTETFTKAIVSIIFHSLGINVEAEDAVFMKADVTLKKSGIQTIKRFLSEPNPSEAMKARLQGELEYFLSPAAEVREHRMLGFLRQLLPFVIGLNIFVLIFILAYYNILRNKRMLFILFIAGLFVHQVNQKVNDDYQKALAERMARETRMRGNPCDPKGYLSAIGTYFGSMFSRMEDPCVEFYKDALSDTPINTKILSNAFYVIGEMIGSPFIGLAETMQIAIEKYFSPAPIYIQWLKFALLIFGMICGVVMALRFWQFEIQSPFLTFRWRVGNGGSAAITHSTTHHHQHAIASPPQVIYYQPIQHGSQIPLGAISQPSMRQLEHHEVLNLDTTENEEYPISSSPNVTLRKKRSHSLSR